MRRFVLAIAVFMICAGLPLHAGDRSIESRLDEAGLRYKVDEDGDYSLVVSYDKEDRTQVVFVSGRTEKIEGMAVREVFSPAGLVTDKKVAGKAMDLLKDSRDRILGAWEASGNYLYYVVKLPDDADAKRLLTAVRIAAESADNMEIELTGDKDAL